MITSINYDIITNLNQNMQLLQHVYTLHRHDIATSHVDPAVKSILESCIVENDADQHVSNLHGVPVVTRIGAADRTVHPWFLRRMYRLLNEEDVKVNHTEVKDMEHWWWDTV